MYDRPLITKKLYSHDSYLQNCSAEIIRDVQVHDKPGVVLDQTVFYPTSGGQPHDTGTINGVAVEDVFEDPNHQLVHILEKPIRDTRVDCRIDWDRRLDHMQQHTGQHILSEAFLETIHAKTLSFHLGEQSATIDIDKPDLAGKAIHRVERLSNQIIFENRDIIVHVVGKNELHRFPIRKQPTVEDHIRIIEIKDFDYSPCGGTHCTRTGEIGLLKIWRCENYKGGSRIHFVCGNRALVDYQGKTEILKQVSAAMSAAESDLLKNIAKLKNDLKILQRERDHLNKKLMDYEAESLCAGARQLGEVKFIRKIFVDRPPKEINLLAKRIIAESPDRIIIFGIKSGKNAQLIFHCSPEIELDLAQLMQKACTIIEGRGGGQPQHAQGGGPAVEKLEAALDFAEDKLMADMALMRC